VSTEAKPLLLFFWSERSGPARRMESLLAHLARKERMRLCVIRIDVEAQPDLVERLRVSEIPTLVLVKGKKVVDRLDGRASAPKIEGMLAQHLTAAPRLTKTGSRSMP
jgi:thioredoxin-like negative regulator of GroEL